MQKTDGIFEISTLYTRSSHRCRSFGSKPSFLASCKIMIAVWSSLVFFFFQAEDGIRDLTVTGVQTCALPISRELDLEPGAPCRPGTGVRGPRLRRERQ